MSNIEIEMKYKINEDIYNEIIEYFKEENIELMEENQNDIYYSPIHFPFLGGDIDNECLRIREVDDKKILSYKKFVLATSLEPAHCIEHELEITDIDKMKLILEDLRIKEEFTLKKSRKSCIYKEKIEISLDKVENLGYFIELEIIKQDDVDDAIKEVKQFINKFNIREDMRNYDGYSYLLFNLNN